MSTDRKPRAVRFTVTMYFGSSWQKETLTKMLECMLYAIKMRATIQHKKNEVIYTSENL
jgi:hypothetical protein